MKPLGISKESHNFGVFHFLCSMLYDLGVVPMVKMGELISFSNGI